MNMAMSADGKISSEDRSLESFGSEADQKHLLDLRTTVDAVMAGARTVDSQPVTMLPGSLRHRRMRLRNGLAEINLRVVVTGSGSVDPDAELFSHRGPPILFITGASISRTRLDRLRKLGDDVLVSKSKSIDFVEAVRWLHREWKVTRLLCEGGGRLNDALFRAGLIDELHLTWCPRLIGGRRAPTLSDGIGFPSLAEAANFRKVHCGRVGDEFFLVYRSVKSGDPMRNEDVQSNS